MAEPTASAEGSASASAASPSAPIRMYTKAKHEMLQPRVACSAPYRCHVLVPNDDGSIPECDCGKQHLIYGKTYQYCTCGLSKTQPLCDDESHEGTIFEPLDFKVDKKQTYYLLCGCKRTQSAPFCDGRHIHITMKDLEW